MSKIPSKIKITLKPKNDTPKTNDHKVMYEMVDLFAGTGAFTLAFEATGKVKTVWSNDIELNSQKIYQNNFSSPFTLQDINDVAVESIPRCDILTGGFSCQPFSIAGLQKGFDDERSNVFWKILKIMAHHRPRIVILENVKNLTSHDHGHTFTTIQENITKLGYQIKYEVINTSDVTNIPQNRERIYIVCFRDSCDSELFSFNFNTTTSKHLSFDEILEKNVDPKYYYGSHLKIWDEVRNNVTKENTFYQYRRYYIRENKNDVCPTLTANMGGGGHNVPLIKDTVGIRKLTPRECFNLQGFPSTYNLPNISDSNLYKLAGNAVSVPVVKKIAERVISVLDH